MIDIDLSTIAASLAIQTAPNASVIDAFNKTGLPRAFALIKNDAGAQLTIYDVIGVGACTAKNFANALSDADGAPLTIRLSSPGGSVFEGWAMYNALQRYEGQTTVIVDGVAASIASVLALGADKVLTSATSLWMVHNAWLAMVGNKGDLREMADTLDKIDQNLAEIYSAKAGEGDLTVWAERMAAETWFTAQEAVDAGLSDAIVEPPKAKAKAKAKARHEAEPASASTIMQTACEGLAASVDPVGSIETDETTTIDPNALLERRLRVRRLLASV